MLCLILPIAACGSPAPPSATSTTTAPSAVQPATPTLSGLVLEVTPGGRVPVADFPVLTAVVTDTQTGWYVTRESTTTGADGRYHFPKLPTGWVVLYAYSQTHRQVCGASAVLGVDTQLDVEITSTANPQPSQTPLTVRGQIYEMTAADNSLLASS